MYWYLSTKYLLTVRFPTTREDWYGLVRWVAFEINSNSDMALPRSIVYINCTCKSGVISKSKVTFGSNKKG
jgi:hypothetical protein